jgi:hypothetical protein
VSYGPVIILNLTQTGHETRMSIDLVVLTTVAMAVACFLAAPP